MLSRLSQEIAHLAHHLPHRLLLALANKLEQASSHEWGYLRALILANTPQAHYRSHVEQLLERWQTDAPTLPASSIALALQSAAHTAQRQPASSELIWTGPTPTINPALRRTEQALLQVIQAAQKELLLVSFAVYRIPPVMQALREAIQRGIELHICLESPQSGVNKISYDPISALGRAITQHAHLYIWPRDQRPTSPSGKIGTLHAKCAIADSTHLFISSANLTDIAMTHNIELGLLIEGGPLPAQAKAQFEQLMQKKILTEVLAK
ncbi:MAG: DISARM system phospholipase D-like protein DrmC [Ardenticatenaceae bacterium]